MSLPEDPPSASVVLPAPDLAATIAFFTELGFQLHLLTGADDPEVAELDGCGLRLRLDRTADVAPGLLRIVHHGPARRQTAPNGTVIEWVSADADAGPESVPAPAVSGVEVSHLAGDAGWGEGRAGMLYRDLVPSRLGGYLIASHIAIPGGGPVPDYVHHHHVRFQMIYCARGWVEVVYEDQGDPFMLQAGDCVVQPPHIRHRVLRSSPGLEVIELACPATHDTYVDHEMTLPTGRHLPGRSYGGQRFVRHVADDAERTTGPATGLMVRGTGIVAATDGLADVVVIEATGDVEGPAHTEVGPEEVLVGVVTEGSVRLDHGAGPDVVLTRGSSVLLPPSTRAEWTRWSAGTHLLTVRIRHTKG